MNDSKANSLLECGMCFEPMSAQERQPVCLPNCGHSFCRPCLILMNRCSRRIECPNCRVMHQGQSPEELPINWALLSLLEQQSGNESNSDSQKTCSFDTREAPSNAHLGSPNISVPETERPSQSPDESSQSGKNTKLLKWSGIAAGAVAGSIGLVAAAPVALAAVGFTSAGIAGSSIAAGMMSSAAIANGGGIAAGSLVAVLQSAGAAGIGATATGVLGGAGASIGAGITYGFTKLFGKSSSSDSNSEYSKCDLKDGKDGGNRDSGRNDKDDGKDECEKDKDSDSEKDDESDSNECEMKRL